MIPADLVLLYSPDVKGNCFVETKNLDGETNLKIKSCPKEFLGKYTSEASLATLAGQTNCEPPNNQIYKFEGNMDPGSGGQKLSLGADNLILKGCLLRNTDYVYGFAVYTGHDSKVMMNSSKPRFKLS